MTAMPGTDWVAVCRGAVEDVWEVAGRGDVLPQKSTFFYPKLTSGLLFFPL